MFRGERAIWIEKNNNGFYFFSKKRQPLILEFLMCLYFICFDVFKSYFACEVLTFFSILCLETQQSNY